MRVSEDLLPTVADGVIVVLGLNYGYRYLRLPEEDLNGEFLLFLVARRHVATDDDGTGGSKCDFAADLIQLIPTGVFDCRGDEQIANVRFTELLLFLTIQWLKPDRLFQQRSSRLHQLIYPFRHLARYTHQCLDKLFIYVHITFVFSQMSLALRLIENAPLLVGQVNRVLQALKHQIM